MTDPKKKSERKRHAHETIKSVQDLKRDTSKINRITHRTTDAVDEPNTSVKGEDHA